MIRLRALVAGALFAALGAAHAVPCTEPVGRDFTAASAADAGLSAARLAALIDALDAGRHDLRALLVLHDCKLALERYREGLDREVNHTVYSVAKSVSSTLVAALLHEGRLKDLDVPLADLVPRPRTMPDADWEKAKQITLRQAMQMSSGLAYQHDPSRHPIYSARIDRFAFALAPAQVAPPGTRYQYSDGDVSMTGAAIAAASGTDLLTTAKARLFEPLQMAGYEWGGRDRAGRYPGGWGLRLRPMDMLKLGQLYLQRGEWNGKRIFAADYPAQAWTAGPSKGYGLHWWLGDPAAHGEPFAFADGFKGQRIYVFPKSDLVIAVSASLPPADEGKVVQLVRKGVVEALRKGRDADAAGEERLRIKVAAGFRGETRVQQYEQDAPRRF